MRSAMIPRQAWPLGRFRGSASLFPHSFRHYSDFPNTTPPDKYIPDVKNAFYKVAVQDGFRGTVEEFNRRINFLAYERAVKLGKFQGTYDAWRLETASPSRKPGTCAYISTLRLDKVIQNGQLVSVTSRGHVGGVEMRRFVLVNGHSVGNAIVSLSYKYKTPIGTLLRIYYDPEKHLLRFQTQDGDPLPQNTDVDLISKAASTGSRPLLVLAHSEGLIPALPDGHLPSFDLQTNLNSGYYVRANRTTSSRSTGRLSSQYQSTISLPDGLGTTNISFKLSEPEKFEYLRFFPYIHEDQTFRLWDIERGVDAPLSPKGVGPWDPLRTKKRFPGLFEHAKRLGYWKEF